MITFQDLPAVNATLNGISAILLAIGFGLIKSGRWRAHKKVMLSAFVVSVLFLISYLTYHASAGDTLFQGQGWIRPVYFTILISHIILAAAIVPLALITLSRALGSKFIRHKKIARWTLPVWFYVSVTGVLIYFMLYHWYPSA